MNATYVNTKFKELLKKHDFPNVHIHDLRHANASLLINMGVPVKVISEHLGHCDTRTTENIYAHVFSMAFIWCLNLQNKPIFCDTIYNFEIAIMP